MNALLTLKSECITALENCILNCRNLIESYKEKDDMKPSIKLCELCIEACRECIEAFKSVQADRAQFIQVYVNICKACIANFESILSSDCEQSILTCKHRLIGIGKVID